MLKNQPKTYIYWLYQPYKWLVFLPLMFVISVVCATFAAIASLLVSPRAGSFFGSLWGKITCWITPVVVTIEGRENIKQKKSYVIVANHQTGWDVFLLYGFLPIDFKWMMKKELRKVPWIGFASEKVGHIFIDRSSPRAAMQSLAEARQKLVNGTSVLIFPEGTRSGKNEMKPFKKGAFKLAIELGLDILPVTIVNSYKIQQPGFFNIFPAKAGLIIHPMIAISTFDNNLDDFMAHTRKVLESGIQ
jgi:1-acyl-sn-glycerol-3-phosphate acyltransferase